MCLKAQDEIGWNEKFNLKQHKRLYCIIFQRTASVAGGGRAADVNTECGTNL